MTALRRSQLILRSSHNLNKMNTSPASLFIPPFPFIVYIWLSVIHMVFLGFLIVSFSLLQMRPLSFNVLALPFSIILFIKHFDSEHHCLIKLSERYFPALTVLRRGVGKRHFLDITIAIRVLKSQPGLVQTGTIVWVGKPMKGISKMK